MRAPQNAYAKAAQDSEWAQWIRLIAKGDEASLGALYDAAVGFVYSVALRITGCPATSEEITENVFFQVWQTAASYDAARGSPRTWLFMICRSHAVSKLRSADMAIPYPDMDALVEAGSEQDADPQSLLMAIQKNTCLHLALESLNKRDQQLLALAFFHELTYSEIASLTKLPLGTVKTNIRRALRSLRSTFQILETRGKHENL